MSGKCNKKHTSSLILFLIPLKEEEKFTTTLVLNNLTGHLKIIIFVLTIIILYSAISIITALSVRKFNESLFSYYFRNGKSVITRFIFYFSGLLKVTRIKNTKESINCFI